MELAMCINRFMLVYFAADVLCSKTNFRCANHQVSHYRIDSFAQADRRPTRASTFLAFPKFPRHSMHAMLGPGMQRPLHAATTFTNHLHNRHIFNQHGTMWACARAAALIHAQDMKFTSIGLCDNRTKYIEVCSQVTGNWRRWFNHITWPVCFWY